jgi:hypothetical protein
LSARSISDWVVVRNSHHRAAGVVGVIAEREFVLGKHRSAGPRAESKQMMECTLHRATRRNPGDSFLRYIVV